MNQPTEAHLDLALQIAEALARSGNVAAAELIAASEARATAELRAALALGPENCDEVYDELRGDCDELRADVVRLTAERDQLRADYERACQTVAQMHAAAVGEVCGPRRGIVEDLSDLRAERDQLRAERYRLVTLHRDAELATERARVRVLHKALENVKDSICRNVPDGYSQPCVDESADECDKIIDSAMTEVAK